MVQGPRCVALLLLVCMAALVASDTTDGESFQAVLYVCFTSTVWHLYDELINHAGSCVIRIIFSMFTRPSAERQL